jgi:hypothetical protein
VQKWDRDWLVAYLDTGAGSQRFHRETGRDAIDEIRGDLTAAWED